MGTFSASDLRLDRITTFKKRRYMEEVGSVYLKPGSSLQDTKLVTWWTMYGNDKGLETEVLDLCIIVGSGRKQPRRVLWGTRRTTPVERETKLR